MTVDEDGEASGARTWAALDPQGFGGEAASVAAMAGSGLI